METQTLTTKAIWTEFVHLAIALYNGYKPLNNKLSFALYAVSKMAVRISDPEYLNSDYAQMISRAKGVIESEISLIKGDAEMTRIYTKLLNVLNQ